MLPIFEILKMAVYFPDRSRELKMIEGTVVYLLLIWTYDRENSVTAIDAESKILPSSSMFRSFCTDTHGVDKLIFPPAMDKIAGQARIFCFDVTTRRKLWFKNML